MRSVYEKRQDTVYMHCIHIGKFRLPPEYIGKFLEILLRCARRQIWNQNWSNMRLPLLNLGPYRGYIPVVQLYVRNVIYMHEINAILREIAISDEIVSREIVSRH